MGWLPPFAQNGKGWAPSCPRVVCASTSEDARAYIVGNGISRTGRVRTTRTSWIVNSRLLAAEGARNDNDEGKPFGTFRLPLRLAQGFGKSRTGSRTRSRAVPGMLAGEGARATQHLRATRGLRPNQYFAVVEEWAAVCPSYSLSFGCVVRCDGAEGEFTDPNGAPTEKPESGLGI